MQYRLVLCGFSEFEYRAMFFSFQHPAEGETGYEVVDAIADADFALVDGDTPPAVKGIALSGKLSRSVFVGNIAPPGAGALVPRPIDLPRILRALGAVAARHAAPPPAQPLARHIDDDGDALPSEPPLLTESVPLWSEPVRSEPVAPVAEPVPAPTPEPEVLSPDEIARRNAKAAARTAARRARIVQAERDSGPGQLEQVRDVLVLDADDAASANLTELLELFGFRVHVARDIAHAAEVLSRCALIAAFLDIRLDGNDESDGIALLQTINTLPRLIGHPTPAVLTVSAQLNPAERVRAALAGIKPLIKPVTRGDVARALESCGVTLPSDARRV
jgi:CheY-like chemotaxis protein